MQGIHRALPVYLLMGVAAISVSAQQADDSQFKYGLAPQTLWKVASLHIPGRTLNVNRP